MGILSYIREQKNKFRSQQDLVQQQKAVTTAKELRSLKEKRIALEGRQKVYDIQAREEKKIRALEEKAKERGKARAAVKKVAGLLQGARKELQSLKSNEPNIWRGGSGESDNIRAAFGMGSPQAPKKIKRKEIPKEAYNPWR